MSTEKSPGARPDALPAPEKHAALQPVAAAPLLPRSPADARGGWPAEEDLPEKREGDEC